MSSGKKQNGDLNRRDALMAMGAGALSISTAYGVSQAALDKFRKNLKDGNYSAQFFTEAEMETMRVIADMVIPADERSGSATDAGTVEYADFVLSISGEETQASWREGLGWIDAECAARFGNERFVDCSESQRGRVLDDIAWPQRAAEEFKQKAVWFNRVRDLIGSGFFSSRLGVEDVGYIGNVYNPRWSGAPPEALRALGVSYDEWDAKYGDLQ